MSVLLSNGLILRRMNPHKIFVTKKALVKIRLTEEKRVGNLLTHINHLYPKADTLYILSKAIPCILCLEMRVAIIFLTMLVL